MTHERTYITAKQAKACLTVVQDYVAKIAGPGWEPALYPPGHEGEFWCVSLEGPDEWALRIGQAEDIVWPGGVWTEPQTSWCLALYPC